MPEPESTGVQPVQTAKSPEFELVDPNEGRAAAYSLANTLVGFHSLSHGQVVLTTAHVRSLERQLEICTGDRDKAREASSAASEACLKKEGDVRVLQERLANLSTLGIVQSICLGMGGVIAGAGLCDSLSALKGYGVPALVCGGILMLTAFIPSLLPLFGKKSNL
jgi:hypothetical protein